MTFYEVRKVVPSAGTLAAWLRGLFVAALMSFLWHGVGMAQQPSESDIEAMATKALAMMNRDEAFLDRAIDRIYGTDLPLDKRVIAKSTMRAAFRNDRLPKYLARLIAPVASPALQAREVNTYVIEGIVQLKVRGLRRLPTERKAQHIRYSIGMAAGIPAGMCKAPLCQYDLLHLPPIDQ